MPQQQPNIGGLLFAPTTPVLRNRVNLPPGLKPGEAFQTASSGGLASSVQLGLACPSSLYPLPVGSENLMEAKNSERKSSLEQKLLTPVHAPTLKRTCEPCTAAKVKCDGMQPCSRCRRRCEESTCVFRPQKKRGRRVQLNNVTTENSGGVPNMAALRQIQAEGIQLPLNFGPDYIARLKVLQSMRESEQSSLSSHNALEEHIRNLSQQLMRGGASANMSPQQGQMPNTNPSESMNHNIPQMGSQVDTNTLLALQYLASQQQQQMLLGNRPVPMNFTAQQLQLYQLQQAMAAKNSESLGQNHQLQQLLQQQQSPRFQALRSTPHISPAGLLHGSSMVQQTPLLHALDASQVNRAEAALGPMPLSKPGFSLSPRGENEEDKSPESRATKRLRTEGGNVKPVASKQLTSKTNTLLATSLDITHKLIIQLMLHRVKTELALPASKVNWKWIRRSINNLTTLLKGCNADEASDCAVNWVRSIDPDKNAVLCNPGSINVKVHVPGSTEIDSGKQVREAAWARFRKLHGRQGQECPDDVALISVRQTTESPGTSEQTKSVEFALSSGFEKLFGSKVTEKIRVSASTGFLLLWAGDVLAHLVQPGAGFHDICTFLETIKAKLARVPESTPGGDGRTVVLSDMISCCSEVNSEIRSAILQGIVTETISADGTINCTLEVALSPVSLPGFNTYPKASTENKEASGEMPSLEGESDDAQWLKGMLSWVRNPTSHSSVSSTERQSE